VGRNVNVETATACSITDVKVWSMTDTGANSILVFDSIHHVLSAERAFQQRGLWCDLVPTPRSVHSDCGMVIEFRDSDQPRVADLVQSLPRKPRAVYRQSLEGFREIFLLESEGTDLS